MPHHAQKDRGVSLLIHHEVKPDSLAKYEAWLRQIIDVASRFPGHQGVFVFKPDRDRNHYEIAVRFAGESQARDWLESKERTELLEAIQPELLSADDIEIKPGIDYWFTSPAPPFRQPVRWKQWLVLSVVVYLLSNLLGLLAGPLFAAYPMLDAPAIRALIVVPATIALTVYLVMPWAVRLTSPWIHQ